MSKDVSICEWSLYAHVNIPEVNIYTVVLYVSEVDIMKAFYR